jgi:hypothetical protein
VEDGLEKPYLRLSSYKSKEKQFEADKEYGGFNK